MERLVRHAESAIDSAEHFRDLLANVEKMSPEVRQDLLRVVEDVEIAILEGARTPGSRLRSSVWHGVLGFLMMGFDIGAQVLAHQTTGPDAKREVYLGRIEEIKEALVTGRGPDWVRG